jgi:glycosyltransferase involved in cell wall biosynthesis
MSACDNPMFSIVIPHYDRSIPQAFFQRTLDSLRRQTYQGFEILLYHDGPKRIPFEEEVDLTQYPQISHIEVTERRIGDWGHTLRDMGIRRARGEYIIHMNADNILYDFALQRLVEAMDTPRSNIVDPASGQVIDTNRNDILIFAILMIGNESDGIRHWTDTRNDTRHGMILSGYPVVQNNIDCMQLVMRRRLWLDYGGWYNRASDGDGYMYPRFVAEHRARYIAAVLGEHW